MGKTGLALAVILITGFHGYGWLGSIIAVLILAYGYDEV